MKADAGAAEPGVVEADAAGWVAGAALTLLPAAAEALVLPGCTAELLDEEG